MSPLTVATMSALKKLSATSGVFLIVFVLSIVSAQDDLELSSQNDLESMDEIQELLRKVQVVYEKKIARKVEEGAVEEEMGGDNDGHPKGCRCSGVRCCCCQYMCIPKLNITGRGCLTIVYNPSKCTILVSLKIGCRWIFSAREISARSPPPICVGVPCFKQGGTVCIQFYNTRVGGRCFVGCAQFLARIGCYTVANYNLGCFRMSFLNATQQVRTADLPYFDGQDAPVEGPKPFNIGEVPMEKIKPSDYEYN